MSPDETKKPAPGRARVEEKRSGGAAAGVGPQRHPESRPGRRGLARHRAGLRKKSSSRSWSRPGPLTGMVPGHYHAGSVGTRASSVPAPSDRMKPSSEALG